MRDFKGMKRQRGRNRSGGGSGGGGGNSGGGGGGGKPSHNVNRAFDSNGPDNVKIRGHAQHVYEKYQQLARDASGAGDRVLAENYLQHAEHYFRVLRSIQPHRTVSEIIGRDALASGFDIDFEDENGDQQEESEPSGDAGEGAQGGEERGERSDRSDRQDQQRNEGGRDQRNDSPRNEGQRNEGQRGEGQRGDRQEPRQDYNRDRDNRDNRPDRQNNNSGGGQRERYEPRGDRPERAYGQGGGRSDNRNNERRYEPRGDEPRGETQSAPARDPMPVVEPEAASPLLRSQDGGVSHAPAYLQAPASPPPAAEGETEARRPRSRSRKPKAEAAPAEGSED